MQGTMSLPDKRTVPLHTREVYNINDNKRYKAIFRKNEVSKRHLPDKEFGMARNNNNKKFWSLYTVQSQQFTEEVTLPERGPISGKPFQQNIIVVVCKRAVKSFGVGSRHVNMEVWIKVWESEEMLVILTLCSSKHYKKMGSVYRGQLSVQYNQWTDVGRIEREWRSDKTAKREQGTLKCSVRV